MLTFWDALRNLIPKAHAEANLPPVLKDFRLLKDCVKDINGKDLREVELQILRHPSDAAAQQLLLDRCQLMEERPSRP